MKTLTGLDTPIDTITGDAPGADAPTYRKLLQLLLGNCRAQSADDARRLARTVPKFRAPAEQVELQPEELKLIRDALITNTIQLSGYLQGQLLLWLEG